MRIGQGYDAHRLAAGKKLVLGGIEIPYEKGLEGHSDADVLTHAIMDALLGAAALGDIGTLFPDTDADMRALPASNCWKRWPTGYGRLATRWSMWTRHSSRRNPKSRPIVIKWH